MTATPACRSQPVRRPTPADRLAEIANRVGRLVPSHRDPERFWHEKSELAAALRALASELSSRGSQ